MSREIKTPLDIGWPRLNLTAALLVRLGFGKGAFSIRPREPQPAEFIGYHLDGSSVTTSFTTDGIIDGTGPLADFQTFNFTGFTDLTPWKSSPPAGRWTAQAGACATRKRFFDRL